MTVAIGPYDGRKARRKRCDACAQRKIKCNGGAPCENCKKSNRKCQMAVKPMVVVPVFVHSARSGQVQQAVSPRREQHSPMLPMTLSLAEESRYLPYFFTSFLQMNVFTVTTIPFSSSLLDMSKDVPELRDAIEAVSALHLTRRGDLPGIEGSNPTYEAMEAYARSVRLVQAKITSSDFSHDPSALWTTFLLGLFELMRDATGINWLSHFLHGTSTLLQLQDPSALSQPGSQNCARRSFFLATRIFEIARALIYTEPTFLNQPEWIEAIAELWKGEHAIRTPKEALFDILPLFVNLSIRSVQLNDPDEEEGRVPPLPAFYSIYTLAQEGLFLQSLLHQWHHDAAEWSLANQHPDMETELSLGYIYHHAISIYLDGAFSYYPTFTSPDSPLTPMLSSYDVAHHVASILHLSHTLLAHGVAGVLLFFPLRVAGARAQDNATQSEILQLLLAIAGRGFVVAQAFAEDLEMLWGWG